MINNNPFGPGRPKVVQDTKDLPDEPGEYRLIDPDPGLIKQAICFVQGKDPNVDHLGIASNLHERVNENTLWAAYSMDIICTDLTTLVAREMQFVRGEMTG